MLHPDKKRKLDDLLDYLWIDACIIYNATNDEPSFASRFLEKKLIDHTYILYDKQNGIRVCIAWWFSELAKNMYNVEVISALQKVGMIQYLIDDLQWYTKVGIAGNIPYKDFSLLQNKQCIDCDDYIKKMIAIKSNYEIQALKNIRNYANKLLELVTIIPGITTENDVSNYLYQTAQADWYDVTFLCITGFDKLSKTTIEDPSNRIIQNDEAICIDFWLYKDGFNSDLTRCYFTGQIELQQAYERIQEVIFQSAKYIVPGLSSKEYITHLEELSKQYNLPWYILVDLGHGIGNFYHEYPDLYHNDFVFENNMVFTLEPEYRVGNYLLRYEDMFLLSDGKTTVI